MAHTQSLSSRRLSTPPRPDKWRRSRIPGNRRRYRIRPRSGMGLDQCPREPGTKRAWAEAAPPLALSANQPRPKRCHSQMKSACITMCMVSLIRGAVIRAATGASVAQSNLPCQSHFSIFFSHHDGGCLISVRRSGAPVPSAPGIPPHGVIREMWTTPGVGFPAGPAPAGEDTGPRWRPAARRRTAPALSRPEPASRGDSEYGEIQPWESPRTRPGGTAGPPLGFPARRADSSVEPGGVTRRSASGRLGPQPPG